MAISAPLTIVCLTFLGGYNTWFKWRSRRGNGGDEEGGMDVDDEGEREGKVGKID